LKRRGEVPTRFILLNTKEVPAYGMVMEIVRIAVQMGQMVKLPVQPLKKRENINKLKVWSKIVIVD